MKIIDLLNKIANGEEVPKKIKWEDTTYAYSEYDKDYLEFPFSEDEYKGLFDMKDSILTQYLNDEVEIIEEEKMVSIPESEYLKWLDFKSIANQPCEEEKKIPEKIKYKYRNMYGNISQHKQSEIDIIDTLNSLIDYLESKGDE